MLGKLAILVVIGVVSLGLLYRFRHRIEHVHPRFRIRSVEAITPSPSVLALPKGSRKRFTIVARYSDQGEGELVSGVTWNSSNSEIASVDSGVLRDGE
jgi:hypothetical protein